MPSSAARLKVFGLCDNKMLGISLRTKVSTLASICCLRPLGARSRIIHANQIQHGSAIRNNGVLSPQHAHASLRVQPFGEILRAGVNLVVTVAAVHAEGCAQVANLVDAIGHGIVHSGDQVSGDHGEIGADVIRHVHDAAH